MMGMLREEYALYIRLSKKLPWVVYTVAQTREQCLALKIELMEKFRALSNLEYKVGPRPTLDPGKQGDLDGGVGDRVEFR